MQLFTLDPLLGLLCTMTVGLCALCLLPAHLAHTARTYGLCLSFVPLLCMTFLWAAYDSQGSAIPASASAPLLGLDVYGLSLSLLTSALFPICLLLLRTVSGMLTFLLLEILLLGAIFMMDLLGFYVLFEATLLLLFLLIGRQPYGSLAAAYKIVLYTLAGSLLFLPVLLSVYSLNGTASLFGYLDQGGRPFTEHRQMVLGWGMLAMFLVKVPLIPVHLWLPEAHVSAPTAGSVLLAGVMLKLGGLGLLRFMLPLMPAFCARVFPLCACLCLVSFVFSTLSTLRQVDLKKVVAYSSIAHMSLITLAILGGSEMSACFMMVAHGLVSPALFLLVGMLYDRYHSKLIMHFGCLHAQMPVLCLLLLLFTLANLSFPLFPNFVGEVLCLVSLYAVHELLAYVFCVCQVLGASYGFWAFARIAYGVQPE